MQILVADPTDEIALKHLQDNGLDVIYNPVISAVDLLQTIDKFHALMVRSRSKVTAGVIEKGDNLKVIGRIGSGCDNIDIETAKQKKITVVNAPDANSIAVAELTVGLMMACLRQFPRAIASMKEGLWLKNELWGRELGSQTVGIIGYGYVGTKVDKLLTAFGAKTLVYSRSYQTATLSQIFEKSDIITLHLSLNTQTRGIITKELLEKMKKTAVFVNISRGQIVDESALHNIVKNKKIAGCILDVYSEEPLPQHSPWRKLENAILTPHIGAATREALSRASLTVANDIIRVLKGEKPDYQVV